MATAVKEKPAPATTNEVAKQGPKSNTETNVVLAGKEVSREEASKILAEMEKGELDSGYLNFEPGQSKRVLFIGWKDIPGLGEKKDEKVKAALFVTDSGKEQINADAVIISYFEKQPMGVARQITCKGKNNSAKGEYKTFDFHELNLKK